MKPISSSPAREAAKGATMIRRAALALAAAVLPVTLFVISVVPASAGTGTPFFTAVTTVKGGSIANAYGGTLEMRWGPDCSVNWTRYTVGTNSQDYTGSHFWISIESSSGVTSYYNFTGQNGVTYYGNEVYSPGPATMCLGINTSGISPQPYCWTQPS